MAPKSKDTAELSIQVMNVETDVVEYQILGRSPLIFNCINTKAQRELLLPSPRKTAADKQASLKHDPEAEFVNSTYRYDDNKHSSRLYFPSTGFKAAICNAALDMPAASKAQIGRLVWVEGENVEIFGLPSLFMRPVRSADMNRTPDIRTRAILPRWACRLTVNLARPLMKEPQVSSLLHAAGLYIGVGDYRQAKGKGSYGQFRLVEEGNKQWEDIVANEGRESQDAMLARPTPYDRESRELLDWYLSEVRRRSELPAPVRKVKAAKAAVEAEAALN